MKVATWKLVSVRDLVVIGATLIAGSATTSVSLLLLLLAGLGSGLLLLTEALSLVLPSSIAWAVTEAVTVPPAATLPGKR